MTWHQLCPGGPSVLGKERSPLNFFVSLHSKRFCHPCTALGGDHRLQLQEGTHCQGLGGAEVLPGGWNHCLSCGEEGEGVAELDVGGRAAGRPSQWHHNPSGGRLGWQ